jgi:8-oxo-dGTP diphosphatase
MTAMTDPGFFAQLSDDARRDGIERLIVGAVITNGSEILLLKRPQDDFMGGIYELPSGNVEAGETLDAALRREVHEETGLQVGAITGYLGSFDYVSASGRKSRQFNFTTDETATGPVRLQEHDAYRWAAPDADAPVTDAVKNVLTNYAQVIAGQR